MTYDLPVKNMYISNVIHKVNNSNIKFPNRFCKTFVVDIPKIQDKL